MFEIRHLDRIRPEEISKYRDAEAIDLSTRRLEIFPADLLLLKRLKYLNLAFNEIVQIPPEIFRLENLEELYIQSNRITNLPSELGSIPRLKVLVAHNNRISEIPASFGDLATIEHIDLHSNSIKQIPGRLGNARSLETLDIHYNVIRAIPAQISKLKQLTRIDLQNNEINHIPHELSDCIERGLLINLDNNSLADPLPSLIARGGNALATYLRSLSEAIPQYEAKVLLVGEGGVGKTSLLAALHNEPFIEGRSTTHGIEIHQLQFRHPSLNLEIIGRAWDFGGQEVYRITHQFFFSRRAIYLLVWKTREGKDQNEVQDWMRRIRLRVGDSSRVLLVATHSDERSPEIDFSYLAQKFPEMLQGNHAVDNRSNRGIKKLRHAISLQAAELPQMGQMLSPHWIAARDRVLELANNKPQVSFDQFSQICAKNGIPEDDITTVAEWLHDMGQIVYYGDDDGLKDIVVLNPEWLTKAISYVLEDTQTRDDGGVLEHARLRNIWSTPKDGYPGYPKDKHPYFLRLMEKFDVCYRLSDSDRSLVTQLVPGDRPDLSWEVSDPLPSKIRSLALICELSEIPPGLIAWLTVRNHHASIGKHWKRGLFLRHPISGYKSEALIELGDHDELHLEVRAPSPDLFFNVLLDGLENLLQRWPGVHYRLSVPCPIGREEGRYCQGRFPLAGLRTRRELHHQDDMVCPECANDVAVSRLLTGFPSTSAALPDIKRLEGKIDQVVTNLEDISQNAADTAYLVRRLLKAVNSESSDCPRMFTLSKETESTWQRSVRVRHRLILWCEHSGYWHPVQAATYYINVQHDWLKKVAPYLTLVVRTLKVAVPLAGAIIAAEISDSILKQTQKEIDLAKAFVNTLPGDLQSEKLPAEQAGGVGKLAISEGAGLRTLRTFLMENDRNRYFGGMRRVQSDSGDFTWVCSDHYSEYDPGLPNLPA